MHDRFAISTTRRALLLIAGCAILAPGPAPAGQHPRLLIKPDDISRLRHACGVDAAPAETRIPGPLGSHSNDFNALRSYFSQRLGDVVLPGELPAAAFLHLVAPDDPGDANRLAAINLSLTRPTILIADPLETILALDWCWDDLEPTARREFLLQMRGSAEPLTPTDSPLDHRVFREKLAAVALALVVDEKDEPSPSWAAFRERILDAAREYFTNTLPTFIEWRGLTPTGPAAAAFEENDTALAIELAGMLGGISAWGNHRDSVGRWMEHYLMAASARPSLQHQFLRDDGSSAPLLPISRWEALQPVTAHLIAARTHDPAAAYVADCVESAMRESSDETERTLWRWVPVVFDLRDVPRANASRLPPARNLDGAVMLRGGNEPDAALVWIDSAQPFLRRGQHFDAGHFLIRAGGYLAVAGGDDIELEATPAKGGLQRLGEAASPFDCAQYFTASIAHNCMIFWDPARVQRWYGRIYVPAGGQSPIEGTCTDFVTPLDTGPRQRARLLAYGHQPDAAYAAIDLTPAYDPQTIDSYTREFVFLWGRVLIVIDRAKTTGRRAVPTWIINLPDRPTVELGELSPQARVAGDDNDAGVWRYDDARWLRWQNRNGALWLRCLLPEPRHVAVVGGPANRLLIADGPHKDRAYIGGDPKGYERLVVPSDRSNAANAWYRLGRPTLLGPHFGVRPHWGRVEITPASLDGQYVFVNALVTDGTESSDVPMLRLQSNSDPITIAMSLGERGARLILSDEGAIGGQLLRDAPEAEPWKLPTEIEPDAPLLAK